MKAQIQESKGVISATDYFYLSFGFIIGIGWIVASGGWIGDAGPLGASLAFFIAGVLLLPVGLCYAELGGRYPVNGGVIYYAFRAFGRHMAFFAAVMFLLSFITVLVFFTISTAWVVEAIFPALKQMVLYTVAGADVTAGGLGAAVLLTVALSWLTYAGATASTRVQGAVVIMLVASAAVLAVAAFTSGELSNLQPLFHTSDGRSAWFGVGAVLITAPFYLSGFEAIAQAFGEKSETVDAKKIAWVISIAILSATLFYGVVIFAAALAAPRELLLGAELPMEAAFRIGVGSPMLSKLVLVAGLFGLLTSWNACLFATARVLSVLGRIGFVSAFFAASPGRTVSIPSIAIPSLIGLAGGFSGREFFSPVVNAASLSVGIVFFLVAISCVVLRKEIGPEHRIATGPFGAFPWIAVVITFGLSLYIVYEPFALAGGRIPIEWTIFAIMMIGAGAYWLLVGQRMKHMASDEIERELLKQ